MKHSLLVTKYFKKLSDKKNLLVFDYAFLSNEVSQEKIKKTKVLETRWQSIKKLNKDYKYLYKLYYKILTSYKNKLNSIHNTNKNTRYWDIVLGKWIFRFLISSYVKWDLASFALKKYDISEIISSKVNLQNFIPSDYEEFMFFLNDFFWNNLLINDIIKFRANIKINYLNTNYKKKKNYYIVNKNSLNQNLIKKFLDKILSLNKNTNITLYKTYFGKKNDFYIFIKKKTLPRFYTEFEKKLQIKKNINIKIRENNELKFYHKNSFELYIKKNIFKYMPASYLEGFDEIYRYSKKINLKTNLIISAVGQTNDIFSIWSANQVEEGCKYIHTEHGGTLTDSPEFDSYLSRYDLFLSWKKSTKKKITQISPQFYIKKTNEIDLKKGKLLGILLTTPNRFIWNIPSHMTGIDIIESCNNLEVLKKLPIKIKKHIKFRLHPNDNFWSIDKRILNNFGKNFISKTKNLSDFIKDSKIIINTTFETAFFQSMFSGKPVIVYFKKDLANTISKDVKKLIFKFKKLNMVFSDKEKLFKHIMNIWENPFLWWESKDVLEARKQFANLCSLDLSSDQFRKNLLKLSIFDDKKN